MKRWSVDPAKGRFGLASHSFQLPFVRNGFQIVLLVLRVRRNDRHMGTRCLAVYDRYTDQNKEEQDEELHYGTFN